MNQDQHILPQVYLKQFGYRNKTNNKYCISVISKIDLSTMEKVGKFWIHQKSIKSFLSYENFFDIPFEESSAQKIFEEFNCSLENKYPKIVQNIEQNDCVLHSDESYLIQFIVNILCRSSLFRKFILEKINSKFKDDFLEEITSNISTREERETFLENFLNSGFDINFLMIIIFEYIAKFLHEFTYILLKSDKLFFTSDNPVQIDYLILDKPLSETIKEVCFPINPSYFIYIYKIQNDIDKSNSRKTFVLNLEKDLKHLKEMVEDVFIKSENFIVFPDEFDYKGLLVKGELVDNEQN